MLFNTLSKITPYNTQKKKKEEVKKGKSRDHRDDIRGGSFIQFLTPWRY